MRRRRRIAIIVAAALMIAVSSCGCIDLPVRNSSVSNVPHNTQESTISILTTNSEPAVNQSFTLHGTLQDGVSSAPIAGQSIYLHIVSPSGQNVRMYTTTTANGSYAFTRSESAQGSNFYQINFLGNSSYFGSSSMIILTVGNPIPTALSLNITDSTPAVNQSFTISGYLTDINGTTLPDKGLYLDALLPNGTWLPGGNTTTDSNGHYSVTFSEQNQGQYCFEVTFWGDNTYEHNTNIVYVAVGPIQPTKVSANTNITNPSVGESYTLSGYLTDANGTPLSGKEINLSQFVSGQLAHPSDHSFFQERYTDQNGYYFFVLNESANVSIEYLVQFLGDQTHAYSNATVALTVGTLTPSTLTITPSTTNPAVNQTFTVSGTLTSNGTPLPSKSIILNVRNPSGNWSSWTDTTTTDANGKYTFTRSESAQGQYLYQAFSAADTYASSNAQVTVTVG